MFRHAEFGILLATIKCMQAYVDPYLMVIVESDLRTHMQGLMQMVLPLL